jgi:hypothetical protein
MAISFYKMFGFPTGVGALVVKESFLRLLKRPWFAGGNVDVVQVPGSIVTRVQTMHQQFEVCLRLRFRRLRLTVFAGWYYQLPVTASCDAWTSISLRLPPLPPASSLLPAPLFDLVALQFAARIDRHASRPNSVPNPI